MIIYTIMIVCAVYLARLAAGRELFSDNSYSIAHVTYGFFVTILILLFLPKEILVFGEVWRKVGFNLCYNIIASSLLMAIMNLVNFFVPIERINYVRYVYLQEHTLLIILNLYLYSWLIQ